MKNSETSLIQLREISSYESLTLLTPSSVTNNLRFPGQYADSETGDHYNFYRTYDNQIGRYIKIDPIGLRGGINLSIYAHSNPIMFSDNLGTSAAFIIAVYRNGPFGGACGPQGSPIANWIPDGFLFVDFTQACQNHDDCYANCVTPKSTCDLIFLFETKSPWYAAFVGGFGRPAFDNARKDCSDNSCGE